VTADAERFWPKVVKSDGCWEWSGAINPFGYGLFQIGHGDPHYRGAHRVSWQMHNGPIPDGKLVCHHCDNRRCVRPDHLFLGTIQDNIRDRDAKARQARGERSASSKLTKDQVVEIRHRHRAGAKIRDLAIEFRMSYPAISDITGGRKWRHLIRYSDCE
jgi:hypothetical protein